MMITSPATLLAHIDIPPRLLGSLIVLGICLLIWFFKAILSTETKASQTTGPSCPTCGGKASWAMPQNYWNCFRCNRPVPVPGQQPPMQQPQQAPQVPFCGACGGPGRWIPESNAWGCDRCRQLIQPR